jgi:hypothetical protein
VVARRLEALSETLVDPRAVVHYPGGLAVDGLAAHDIGAEGLTDGLVTEADPQGGDTLTDPRDQLDRDPRLVRCAGTG